MSQNSEKKEYVTYGRAQNCDCGCGCALSENAVKITGCRFALSIMDDRYISIILGALEKTKTDKIWQETGRLSTVYRGKQCHVEDAVKACFVNAFTEGVHMTMEMTFSRGCPGDVEADVYMAEDDVLQNESQIKDIHFPVNCKIALYPMGVTNYMEHIAKVVNHAIDLGIYDKSTHYCTLLKGDVHELFSYFDYVNTYCSENLSHYVFEVTLSVNSPTAE
ncbi:YKOF-related Family [Lachnospiraceae bacterium]|nr:YKOF-related Family [Lachnospiraceae bacterium]